MWKIPRKYCVYVSCEYLTNSAEWMSIWMIKFRWSANTRRENLLAEILIRGDKKTKIVLFVRELVLKVSLWKERLARSGKEIWQKLISNTTHPWHHLYLDVLLCSSPRKAANIQTDIQTNVQTLMYTNSWKCANISKSGRTLSRPVRELQDERTEVWLGQMSKLH